jgi:aminoglycoside phosphotransferase (APT) family kinase protein
VTTSTSDFAARAARYLRAAWDRPDLQLEQVQMAAGGISRQTWFADAHWESGPEPRRRAIVFRVDQEASLLPSRRGVEFAIYHALWQHDVVPVPEPLLLEDDPLPLGNAFFLMDRVAGEGRPGALAHLPRAQARALGTDLLHQLGRLAGADHRALGFDTFLPEPSPEAIWEIELDRWERELDAFPAVGSLPVTRAAIRRLRDNPPPPPPRVGVVHGDFRVGNFLAVGDRVTAIVDWEMAHLGDPHEDLAWCLAQGWRNDAMPELVAGMLAVGEAIRVWEEARGAPCDPHALAWYRLFTHVKANALWATAACQFPSGTLHDLAYALLGRGGIGRQEQWAIDDIDLDERIER